MNRIIKPFCHREPFHYVSSLLELENLNEIKEVKGVYIIAAQQQSFIYPNGNSKVFYIGKSNNLRRRMKQHKAQALAISETAKKDRGAYWYYPKHQYLSAFGGQVFFFSTRGTQDEQNLESALFASFYDRYHSFPVSNGAMSFEKIKKSL